MTRHLLHVFSTFGCGGPQVRTARIINALGSSFHHTIVATDGRFDAASLLSRSAPATCVEPPPGKGAVTYPLVLRKLLRRIAPDLLITYNWGAIDAVVAAQLGGGCPIVHTEDGFGPDESVGLKRRRVWTRRVALRGVTATVVPSKTLRDIAVNTYWLRPGRVVYIPNGVDVLPFDSDARAAARASLGISDAEVVIGTVASFRREKHLALLLEAFARLLDERLRLVLVGDGPTSEELRARSHALGLGARVVFTGHREETAPLYRSFDVFAMSSITEQLPFTLLEAMAAGLPCVATDVGDCAHALGTNRAPEVIPPNAMEEYVRALETVCASPSLRREIGVKNRERCVRLFSSDRMIAAYERIYSGGSFLHYPEQTYTLEA